LRVLILADTGLLIVLTVLMVGLLRGHAELLRRTGGIRGQAPAPDGAESSPSARPKRTLPEPRAEDTPAWDVVGRTLQGDSLKLAMRSERNTLLAFLSSGCLSCQPFWEQLGDVAEGPLPGDARLVVVVKDSSYESPSRLRPFLSANVPIVMSSQAWSAYKVEMAPYFIYVDGNLGAVMSEGAASSWPQVLSLLGDAIADHELALESSGR
jgi:hypothetical protein